MSIDTRPGDKVIALAGNPNVGKSTVFNQLTGSRQHTGNWPGKTVSVARGQYTFRGQRVSLVDLPGTYSLLAHSAEEEVARDFLCFDRPDGVVVVCDATCLSRNMNLVLQTLEITDRVIMCVNLLDEASKKHLSVDLPALSARLGVPVIGTAARSKKGLRQLEEAIAALPPHAPPGGAQPGAGGGERPKADGKSPKPAGGREPGAGKGKKGRPAGHGPEPDGAWRADENGPEPGGRPVWDRQAAGCPVRYSAPLEHAVSLVQPAVEAALHGRLNSRWVTLRLLEGDPSLRQKLDQALGTSLSEDGAVHTALAGARQYLLEHAIPPDQVADTLVSCLVLRGEELCEGVLTGQGDAAYARDRKWDRWLLSRRAGIPLMLLLLCLVLWITLVGANYPSSWLSAGFDWLGGRLSLWFDELGAPGWLHGLLLDGMYRVLSWVIAVMLPPMAIFFPLFTLLEDFGYLPRVAFNLDSFFQRANACGKQALTMCMGFGCNAVGVTGCRIIDSPRERLIAVLTNNFVPCNGRFPALITLVSLFFIGAGSGLFSTAASALALTAILVFGVLMTLLVSKLLSGTLLRGVPSSFTLELPPYRVPQFGKVLLCSLRDRTLFVLGRAAVVAAPAGLLIWAMANVTVGDLSLLAHCAQFLDPLGRLMGMDGVILMAFILGFPANEIVIPLMIMAYLSQGSLLELGMPQLHALLLDNGWTWVTALCVMLFSLLHWPCSTTCFTIYKETHSVKWTAIAVLLPTGIGIACCMLVHAVCTLAGF